MKTIRKGSDIVVRWRIFRYGQEYDIALYRESISLVLSNMGEKKEITDYSIVDVNTIVFKYRAEDQGLGIYRLLLIDKSRNSTRIIEECNAFRLVNTSDAANNGGTLESAITITLTSELTAPADGLSAYEVALQNGFIGTEEEWLQSLKGEQGPQGIQGDKGDKGDRGEQGEKGLSAYQVAIANGFVGTEAEWLQSLVPDTTDIELAEAQRQAKELERIEAENARQSAELERQNASTEAVASANAAASNANAAASSAQQKAEEANAAASSANAVVEGFNSIIVQGTGDAQDKVMSQKAVTDAMTASQAKLSELLENEGYSIIRGSIHFSTPGTTETITYPVFLTGQESLVGQAINGIKIYAVTSGNVVLCKCSNYKLGAPVYTELQTFDVRPGVNWLMLSNPFVLEYGEGIGISNGSTAKIKRIDNGTDGNIGYLYYTSRWNTSNADIVMAILSGDVSAVNSRLNSNTDSITELEQFSSITKNIELSGLRFVQGYYSASDGGLVSVSNRVSTNSFIRVIPNTTILFSGLEGVAMAVYRYGNNKEFLGFSKWFEKFDRITIPDDCCYIRLSFQTDASSLSISEVKESGGKITGVGVLGLISNIRDNAQKGNILLSSYLFESAVTGSETPNLYGGFIDGCESLYGQTVSGIKINIKTAGIITFVKCSNFRADEPVFEDIQSFDVVSGINYLYFDTPITLGEREAIGISKNTTAGYFRDSYVSPHDRGYWYYNASNKWVRSGADIVMAYVGLELTGVINNESTDVATQTQASVGQHMAQWGESPFMAHLFVDKISANSDVIIPSQSVYDIEVAHRLGFKVFELNTQITSDGDAICMHGVGGALGYEVTDLNGDFAPDVKFADLTIAELQSNYIYRSTLAKFRTPMTDLDTALRELKKRNMIPYVSGTSSPNILKKIKSVFGNNFIAYGGIRSDVPGIPISIYSSLTTKEEIIAQCDRYGSPYCHAFSYSAIMSIYKQNATTYSGTDMTGYSDEQLISYFDGLSENQQIELININKSWFADVFEEIHKRNCYISSAPCYDYECTTQMFLALGADCCLGSDSHVPDFDQGNIVNLDALLGFDSFTHNGTVQNGILTLAPGQTISVDADVEALAKGSLHVRFQGTLNVDIGHKGANKLVSDGKESMWFSRYFLNAAPKFTLTAVTETKIITMDWKSSKC